MFGLLYTNRAPGRRCWNLTIYSATSALPLRAVFGSVYCPSSAQTCSSILCMDSVLDSAHAAAQVAIALSAACVVSAFVITRSFLLRDRDVPAPNAHVERPRRANASQRS